MAALERARAPCGQARQVAAAERAESAHPPVRLIADDLTGALDAAIAFVRPSIRVPVYWDIPPAGLPSGGVAFDSGTREAGAAASRRKVAALAGLLPRDGASLFYAKLDSLLRGQAAADIAGWMEAMAFDRCIVAPAFPHHGRITRGGLQFVRRGAGEQPVATDLAGDLRKEGLEVRLCRPGDAVPDGVSLWDAESDADLARLVAAGRPLGGTTLWCGSGGLALALAGTQAEERLSPAALPRPILGLFGTDHPVTREQIAACGTAVLALPDGGDDAARAVADRLARKGAALAFIDMPDAPSRAAAAARIAHAFDRLVQALDPPGTLVVAGGETLRGLCGALGAERLELYGQIETGIPCSILRGGRFDGVHVVSKSGAFGDPQLLRRLIVPFEGDHA
ncbi:hypothetical protein KHC19_00845 [Ancylobacter oerskovii]|nr:hypothetical protein [Ancylobacter oerskovii]